MKRLFVLATASFLVVACAARPDPDAQIIALVGGVLIDGTGAIAVPDSAIVLDGDRIVAAGRRPNVDFPDTAQVIDVSGRWIMPGMIDTHVHLSTSGGLFSRPPMFDLSSVVSPQEEAAFVRERAPYTMSRYLCSGVTSIVDLGGPSWIFDLRSVAEALDSAPRVFIAGPFAQNGPVEVHFSTPDDPGALHLATAEAARAFVHDLVAKDADVVKTGFDSVFDRDLDQYLQKLAALLDEGRQAGLPVLVHAPELAITQAALEAGAERFAHTIIDRPMDEQSLRLAVDRRAMFVSALSYLMSYRRILTQTTDLLDVERLCGDEATMATWSRLATLGADAIPPLPPIAEFAELLEQTALENIRLMHEAGLVIAIGSDAGNIGSLHGPAFHRDLVLMERAGVAPAEILVAATLNGARILGKEDELGSIEAGKLADMLVLTADPTESVANFSKIEIVISRGRIIDRETLLSNGASTSQ